ncbi:type II restriction endonuclease subunit M [Thiorhodococcus minor]|uniref:Type II restriction endonuclease subunit M n=1 Tax=Thiorhodococcus minor TaxID=57489 RepID=A0A6M0K167_9GAMM|nr:type II restriction endonuclease subunit M [Thiorhodococcus minor]NEV62357.1 type II restriction endonuclease subunit M [Thiorhodococcus minor]
MTQFLRLLAEDDKAQALLETCTRLRAGEDDSRHFEVTPDAFDAVPGKPFAYWVSEAVRETFVSLPSMSGIGGGAKCGLGTLDDFRFLRLWWEAPGEHWIDFAKGGNFSPWYSDIHLLLSWQESGKELKQFVQDKVGSASRKIQAQDFYFRPGLTWPRRTNGLSFRVMPAGCIFADKGPAAFVVDDDPDEIFGLCAVLNSRAFDLLVSVQLARTELAQSYEVGLIQQTPIPQLTTDHRPLTTLAKRAWSLKRTLDTVNETSHAFLLPATLRPRLGDYDPPAIQAELEQIQAEIDSIAFDLYGFSEADRAAALGNQSTETDPSQDDDEDEQTATDTCPLTTDTLLSWSVGVAFGRFDWRLATGERAAPPEPDPFDPLPPKSPGMLPDDAEPFHAHPGILVDDPGHPHDLARLIEDVLERVGGMGKFEGRRQKSEGSESSDLPSANCLLPSIPDPRSWLRRDFFPLHLKQYSKSRRKAPIYWPLATGSGSYCLWVYYPDLTSQTLYTAVNDFLDPKLEQVGEDVAVLRNKGTARSREEEKRFEALQGFELELTELRDTLLKLAPGYRPNQDDGVQITAAPLWPLFRHKPWQKVLKDTWNKLQKGDYDWSHLAMAYWPERVREACKTDKSLAIAHGLESLCVEPAAKPKKTRGRRLGGAT